MTQFLRITLTASLVAVFFGCVTHQSLGDKSYNAGNFKEALDHYIVEIDEGSQDPEVFKKAARSALKIGSFASSERYYSRALSYGAGIETARELAQLYVKTSNYGSAVRVYQYLISKEKNPQPVYNNLGTALMYAGSPFDAESYLLVAQQLDPSDPYPYVNLGLLYDRYLKQPWRSAAFYRCFETLASPEAKDLALVAQRRAEIENKYLSSKNEVVECGTAYHPSSKSASLETVKREMKRIDDEFLIEGSETTEPPTVVDLNAEAPKKEKAPEANPTSAMIAYREGRFSDAKTLFNALPVGKFDAETTRAFGDTLIKLKEYQDAERWLEMSLGFSDVPDTVRMLVDVSRNTGNNKRREALCVQYAERPGYSTMSESCSDVLKKPTLEESKESAPKGTKP